MKKMTELNIIRFDDVNIKRKFCETFKIDPETRMIQLRKV